MATQTGEDVVLEAMAQGSYEDTEPAEAGNEQGSRDTDREKQQGILAIGTHTGNALREDKRLAEVSA